MTTPATVAALTLLVAFLGLVLRDVRRSTRPRALVSDARYAEARTAADTLAASWMRLVPGVRDGARYVSALARHLEGDLAGAASDLARLAPRDPGLRYAARTLEAASLVLADEAPDRALAAVREARALSRADHPEDDVLEALVLVALGRADEVPRATRTALAASPGERAVRVEEAATLTLRALLTIRLAETDGVAVPSRARAELAAAVRAAPAAVYARVAEAALAKLAPAEEAEATDDGTSSLAPQTLSAGGSRPPRA